MSATTDALNKAYEKGWDNKIGPVMGGLKVDPTQRRMARLEKLLEDITVSISRLDTRIAVLEGKTKASEIRKVAHS